MITFDIAAEEHCMVGIPSQTDAVSDADRRWSMWTAPRGDHRAGVEFDLDTNAGSEVHKVAHHTAQRLDPGIPILVLGDQLHVFGPNHQRPAGAVAPFAV